MIKRITAGVAALIVALGLGLAVASPASASYSQCTLGHGCIYQFGGGGNPMLDFAWSTYHDRCVTLTGTWPNTMSSSVETYGSGFRFHFFSGPSCTGLEWWQPDDTEAEWTSIYHNDNMESLRIEVG